MKTCSHRHRKRGEAIRKFRKLTFKSPATVCGDCDAVVWDDELQAKYVRWLIAKQKKSPSLFMLQPFLSKQARDCLEQMKADYPSTSDSFLIRALVILYLSETGRAPLLNDAIEDLTKTPQFKALRAKTDVKRIGVKFGAQGLLTIEAWAELTGLAPTKVVEEALYRMLTLYLTVNPQGKRLWTDTFRDRLSSIILAAA